MAEKKIKKRSKILLILVLFVLILSITIFSFLGKVKVGLFIDKMNLTHNSFIINVDKSVIQSDLYLYWLGETEYTDEKVKNKILIYHHKIQSDIPDSYGKNWLLIKYKDKVYNKAGILKLYPYAKHDYKFDIRMQDENFIINWKISNWYTPDIYQGTDTLKLY